MNYELQILNSTARLKKAAERINKKNKRLALQSFSTENRRDGTMGQFCEICANQAERDMLLDLYEAVRSSICGMPADHRALLRLLTAKKLSCAEIARRLNQPIYAVYRKRQAAYKSFRRGLCALGYTQEWFDECFDELMAIANKALL